MGSCQGEGLLISDPVCLQKLIGEIMSTVLCQPAAQLLKQRQHVQFPGA